jgi:signal transduction histidine kinase
MASATGFGVKLTAGLVLMMLVMSLAAVTTLRQSAAATAEHQRASRSYVDERLRAERLRSEVEQTVSALRGYLLSGSPELLDRMRRAEKRLGDLLASLGSQARSADGRQLVESLRAASQRYQTAASVMIDARQLGADSEAVTRIFERELLPRRRELDILLDRFEVASELRLEARSRQLGVEISGRFTRAAGTFALGVLVSVGLCLVLGRHLTTLYRREQAAITRAEQAAQARQELLAIVAHDLRNPLGAIALRATMLRRDGSDEISRNHGAAIERVVSRMEQLLKGLLDAATIEAGQLSLRPAAVDVAGALLEVADTFSGLASSKGVQLVCRPAPDQQMTVQADRERLLQVLANLIGNSIKFTASGDRIELSATPAGNGIRFSVADSGPGISPEHLPWIFERFWKADFTGAKGTGLGLYIARRIVVAHGGRIWAESRPPSEGTTIHFVIPAGQRHANPLAQVSYA